MAATPIGVLYTQHFAIEASSIVGVRLKCKVESRVTPFGGGSGVPITISTKHAYRVAKRRLGSSLLISDLNPQVQKVGLGTNSARECLDGYA